MPSLLVKAFDGIYPRTSPTSLATAPTSQAQQALNIKLYSGEIRTWNGPTLVYSPSGITGVQTIYRLYDQATGNSIWLTSKNIVEYVPGPISDVNDNRIYYTGDGTPRKTNYARASAATPYPSQWYEMGTPAPTSAPTVVSSSSSTVVEDRVYIYTYLTTFGTVVEESAPSPASAIVGVDVGATVTVSGFAAPTTTGRNFTGINIYRSVSGSTTSSYEFVTTIPLSTTSYVDSLATLALGAVCPSIGWDPPPAAMIGLTTYGDGSLAGFVGNTVYLSVPYYPHAWPAGYSVAFPHEVVALAPFSGGLVVMTTKRPYLLQGLPGSTAIQFLPLAQPCLHRRTVVSNENGVLYASPEGMVSVGTGGAQIVTHGLFRRAEWQALNPASMQGIYYDSQYFGVMQSPYSANTSVVIDASDIPALSLFNLNATCAFSDQMQSDFYVLSSVDGNIYQVDADALHPYTYTWMSKRYVNPQAVSMSAMKVDADYSQTSSNSAFNALVASVTASNTALFSSPSLGPVGATQANTYTVNGSTQAAVPTLAATVGTQIFVYGDGQELICAISPTSYDPIRLPAFKSRELSFKITGTISVRSVQFATTMRELAPEGFASATQHPSLFQ